MAGETRDDIVADLRERGASKTAKEGTVQSMARRACGKRAHDAGQACALGEARAAGVVLSPIDKPSKTRRVTGVGGPRVKEYAGLEEGATGAVKMGTPDARKKRAPSKTRPPPAPRDWLNHKQAKNTTLLPALQVCKPGCKNDCGKVPTELREEVCCC